MTEVFAVAIITIALAYVFMPLVVMMLGLVYAVFGTLFNLISRK